MEHLKGTKIVTAVLIGCLLASCSTLSLTYNFADWIVLWKIDHYFDLSLDQRQTLEKRLANFHTCHRTQELPLYANFLRQIQKNLHDRFTQEGIETIFQSYFQLRASLGQQIAFEGTPFLVTVMQKQIDFFQNAIREENKDLLQEIDRDFNERLAKRTESILDWLENWVGKLTELQKQHISELIKGLPDTDHSWMHYRRHRQKQFIDLLQTKKDSAIIEKKIGEWFTAPENDMPTGYIKAVNQMRSAIKVFIWEIDQTITLKQRQHGIEKLQKLIDEVENLVLAQTLNSQFKHP